MSGAKEYKKKEKLDVSQHFNTTEFDCPCSQCCTTLINPTLISKLEILREILNQPILITSGYRCAYYQEDLKNRGYETAVGVSQHQLGNAVDLKSRDLTGEDLAASAEKAGFKAIGIGQHFIHVDLRDDKPKRRWSYSY